MENMVKDELREWRKQKIASLSQEEVRNLMNQGTERIAQEAHDQFVRRHVECSKQGQTPHRTEPAASNN